MKFWCEQIAAYPNLAKMAMKVLILFTTAYLCESGFCALVKRPIKSNCRNMTGLIKLSDDDIV